MDRKKERMDGARPGGEGEELRFTTLRYSDNFSEADGGALDDRELDDYTTALYAMRENAPGDVEWEKAKDILERLCTEHPANFRIRQNHAVMLDREGRHAEAMAAFEAIFEAHPSYGHAAAVLMRDAVANDDLDRAEAVIARYRPAPEMEPGEHLAYLFSLSRYYAARGDAEKEKTAESAILQIVSVYSDSLSPGILRMADMIRAKHFIFGLAGKTVTKSKRRPKLR